MLYAKSTKIAMNTAQMFAQKSRWHFTSYVDFSSLFLYCRDEKVNGYLSLYRYHWIFLSPPLSFCHGTKKTLPFLLWLGPESWHYHGRLALPGVLSNLAGKSGPAGVICAVMDGQYHAPALLDCTVCLAKSCWAASWWHFHLLVYVHNLPSWPKSCMPGSQGPALYVNSFLVGAGPLPQSIRSLFGPLLPNLSVI